jgi:hypothetical protein
MCKINNFFFPYVLRYKIVQKMWETYVGKIRRFLDAIRSPNGAHAMLIKLGIKKRIL